MTQIDFMPFDPTIKRTEGTLRTADGKTFKTTKGAPHIILKLVEIDQEEVAKRVNWKVRGRRGHAMLCCHGVVLWRHYKGTNGSCVHACVSVCVLRCCVCQYASLLRICPSCCAGHGSRPPRHSLARCCTHQ